MSVPASTYRLQLHPGFDLDAAAELVPHLHDLGVGAVYTSPVLDATPGSTHGYDVTDPRHARPELGGEAARLRLAAAAREAGMGLVVDIVPNHMSIEVPAANPSWWDVLRLGPDSAYAPWYDVDWSAGRVLVPVLGDAADVEHLQVDGDELTYYDHRYPIAPGTGDGTPQQVHDRQHYELVDWRRGSTDLTYRRFFDVTTLAAVRVERPEVLEQTHREVLRWVSAGEVTGLRVDHPDGLADPGGYARDLRAAAPDAWIVVEKILHPGEPLPASWPVDGTTGYDALREVCGVFVDPAGEAASTDLAARLGAPTDYAATELEARRLVTDRVLVAEVRRIAALLQDVDVEPARGAVAETMVAFGVYRSYLPEGEADWAAAVRTAQQRRPDLADALEALDAQVRADPGGELATRIQQTSGMVVAKGTEDTTFYRYTRFVALNEVGGSPADFGVPVADFHRSAAERQAASPHAMTALSTHDTKRSEDVRARLAVLAELPEEVPAAVARWSAAAGIDEPSLDLLAWQTLLGAWPISDDRLAEYLLKAAKESKLRTTWTEPDEAFEEQVRTWPARVRASEVWAEVEELAARITGPGWSNALGQKLVHLAGPGVPDVYQGTELWDLSLVDPDNRRPVNHDLRRALLARLVGGWLPPVDDEGGAKLLVVQRTLTLRRDRPDLFTGYRPVAAEGEGAEHALAFSRTDDLVALATRLPVGLAERGGWGDTTLPLADGTWTDVLTGEPATSHRLADLLARYPVALLVRS